MRIPRLRQLFVEDQYFLARIAQHWAGLSQEPMLSEPDQLIPGSSAERHCTRSHEDYI